MIDLNYLATALNSLIGTDKYLIYVYTNAFPEDLGNRSAVTMNVSRVPFGFDNTKMDAESMIITLAFDLPTSPYGDDLITRDIALDDIQKTLLGRRKFKIITPDGEYIVNSAFEQQPPSNPYTDPGRITQQIVISGTALIQSIECHAIVGNDIIISIDGTELLGMEKSMAVNVGTDPNIPISENDTMVETTCTSRANTKTISFMYMGKEIEKKFLRMAEGEPYDINEIHTYKASYVLSETETLDIVLPVKIISVTSQSSLGTFLQYTLNLIVVKE